METLKNAQVLFVKEIAETMRMSPVTVYKAIQRLRRLSKKTEPSEFARDMPGILSREATFA